jgi:2'-5' RNA ligase
VDGLCYWTDITIAKAQCGSWADCKGLYARDKGVPTSKGGNGTTVKVYFATSGQSLSGSLCGVSAYLKAPRTEWTVPLYMFTATDSKGDVVGVSTVDSVSTLTSITGNNGRRYAKLLPDPVGFLSKTKTAFASVELVAYYSSERKDVDVNVRKPSAAGNYKRMKTLGYLASQPKYGVPEALVPLWGYYNRAKKNNLCGPFSSANDVNRLVLTTTSWNAYRKGHLFGYMGHGHCQLCNTSAVRTWGNLGGPGCPYKPCSGKFEGFYYDLSDTSNTLFKQFHDHVRDTQKILKHYGSFTVKSISGLHLTVNYLCGLDSGRYKKAKEVLLDKNVCGEGWPQIEAKFTHAEFRFDRSKHYSVILMASPTTEIVLQNLAAKVERCLQKHGVAVLMPRKQSWVMHVTLGSTTGGYAGEAALKHLNERIDWSTYSIPLPSKPRFH